MKIRLLVAAFFVSLGMMAANTVTTNGNQITSNVNVAANTDYVLTRTSNLFRSGTYVNIPSASMEHSTVIFQKIKPSVVKSNWLSYVKINGSTAVDGTNCQVKMYGSGTIIMPYSSSFQPLTCYTGTNFTGSSYSSYTTGSNGGYMKTLSTAQLKNNFKSFKLKRGYMVTFATGESGYGYSRCFIADTEDLEIDLPTVLSGKVSSYRLFVWYDAQKKGLGADTDVTHNSALNTSWCYDWGAGFDHLPDQECVPHKIHKNWPGVADCGSANYSCHMKTDNEPANSADDTPGTVDEILGYWEDAMRTGMRLCAPSSHDGGYGWQEEFMNAIDARGWRCDILDIHCYWASGFSDIKSRFYDKYHRPVWISEWIWGASWSGNGAFASGVSDNTIYNNTVSILSTLNNMGCVERYAYWNSESKAHLYESSITNLGQYYADMESGIAFSHTYEFIPVVVIKNPFSLNVVENSNGSITLTWKDANGDMMDEIQVQYKPAGSSTWQVLSTVIRKDKTNSSNQSYSYSTTVSDWENCSFRIVDMFENTEYPSLEYRKLTATDITELTFIPSNTEDFFFQFYSKEASSDMLWALGNSNLPDDVFYRTPDTPGNDLTQLWTLEANSYGGFSIRNLSSEEYVMCSPAAWNFISNQSDYKNEAAKATYLPIYYSNGDYWVMKNVAYNMYVGLWDNDKNFAVGERLAGNRTNPTGSDSGDKLGIRAIPRELVYNQWGVDYISGTYYVYNPNRNLFLTAANDWGTQASLGETGLDLNIIQSGAYNIIDTNISNGGESHYFGTNLYMDAGSANWTIAESGTWNGKTTYSFTVDGGTGYIAAPTSGTVVTTVSSATNDRAKWVLMTKADLVSQMSAATETNPVNATFLLPGYGFSRNDGRNGSWNGSPAVGGAVSNMNGEKFNTTFDVYQELTDIPDGIYEVTMQGFYRDGGYNDAATLRTNGNEALNAILYLNDVENTLPSIFEGAGGSGTTGVNTSLGYIPNTQEHVSAYMNAGKYTVGPIRVTVDNGSLRIGVKKTEAVTNDWTAFDNFKLMYYGPATTTFLGSPVWNIENDSYIQSYDNLTLSYPSAESTASGATFAIIGNPTVTLSDGQNTYNATLSLSGKTVTMNFNGFTLAPGKDYTVSVPANTVGFNGLKTNDAMTLTFHTPVLYDNYYYLYNNAEQKYVSRNGTWNTQAVMDDYGVAIKVETDAQGNTHFKCFDNNLFIFDDGNKLYADGGTPANFTPIAVDGGYRFMNKANSLFLGVNGSDLMANRTSADASSVWTLEALADHVANYTRNADAQAAQAATDAQLTGITTVAGLAAKLAEDYVTNEISITGISEEKFIQYAAQNQEGSDNIYFTETVENLKPGIYRLSADAFQRAATNGRVAEAGGARGLIFLFANDAKTQLKSVMEYGAASAYESDFEYNNLHYPNNAISGFTALETGNYNNEIYVYVPANQGSTTGTLTFGIKIENRLGNGITADTWAIYENFKLEYLEPYYILDETSGTPPTAATGVTVKFKRTITDKYHNSSEGHAWNTICFPFELSSTQITEIFGEGTVVKELSGVTPVGENASLIFADVSSIEANTPYIMQVEEGNAQSEYIIENIDITPSENLTVTIDGLQFIGNYTYPHVLSNTNGTDYYILNDQFKSSTGRTKIKGFRAYFHVPNGSNIKALGFGADGEATSIDGIEVNVLTVPADIYSIGGQLIRKQADSLNGLPSGIYFINGRKVLIK